jgi:hypothetical protein
MPGEYTGFASLPVIGDVDAVLTAAPIKVRIDPKAGAPRNWAKRGNQSVREKETEK